MALVRCKECRKEVSNTAAFCPHCGAKIRRSSLRSFLLLLVAGLFVVAVIGFMVDNATNAPATRTAEQGSDLTPHWTYTTTEDKMTQEGVKQARLDSLNRLNFSFPYQGSQSATIALRLHPRYGKSIILSVERGQFLCGVDGCTVDMRFDDGKPETFDANEPSDHSTTVLFIDDFDRFVSRLRESKKVYISAEFYQQGRP